MTTDDLITACRNIGINLECGGCTANFFGASVPVKHESNCTAARWIPFTERMPEPHSGFLLVTNNLSARDAFGHMSHVWLVGMVHLHTSAVQEGSCTYAEAGEITAFAEPTDRRIRGLTHWRLANPEDRHMTTEPARGTA